MNKGLPVQRGQVVLVILLVMSVILVVGLSVVSRSITDVKLSQQSQESARALWVAQAGLEQAIRTNAGIGSTYDEGLSVNYSVVKNDIGGTSQFVFPDKIGAGESVTFWFLPRNETTGQLITSPYTGPSSFVVGWGNSETSAIEITIFYNSGGVFKTQRHVYGPSVYNGTPTNFSNSQGPITIAGTNFMSKTATITLPAGTPYFMQLKPLLNNLPQSVGVMTADAGKVFPKQGSCFISTAAIPESGVTRKLEQCQLWPTVPSIFNYLLFSKGSIGGGV